MSRSTRWARWATNTAWYPARAGGSTSRATTLAIGFFVVFEFRWDVVPLGNVYVVNGFSLLPDVAASLPTKTFAGASVDAVYAVPEIGLVVLAFWMVVPLAVGYYRFDTADL
nr:ABC transporter permease subunit [Halosimplex aquaticum]